MKEQEINPMEEKMNSLEKEVNDLKEEVKGKNINSRNLRLKSDNNGRSNVVKRISRNLFDESEKINYKRIEKGLNELSLPKMTDLIVKHKFHWLPIRQDIIDFENGK